MKIIDENGIELTGEPDLAVGYLVEDIENIHHEAIEAVAPVTHYEFSDPYPSGGRDRRTVVDKPGVPAKPAWDEEVPVMRYIRYTEDEIAQREAEKKAAEEARAEAERKQKALDELPDIVKALQLAQSDTDALMVDQEYRVTLLELGVTEDE